MSLKVLYRSPMSSMTGYGNDGLGMVQEMNGRGVDVYLRPQNISPPWPENVAILMMKAIDPPFDLYLNHGDPGRLECSYAPKNSSTLSVGWTMWEYTTFQTMDKEGRRNMEYGGEQPAFQPQIHWSGVDKFDILVCYDSVTQQAYEHFFKSINQNPPALPILSGGYLPEDWEAKPRDWFGDPFRFCMIGQLHPRKDPFVAIQAFRELKDEGELKKAELHLKTTIPGLHPMLEENIEGLKVHYVTWSREMLQEFMYNCHVLLAPSRGEGKNMPALEFMSSGGTVIATNWGGHTSWLSSEFAYPLDYRLAPEPGLPECMSARASVSHMKELMLETFTNRGETKRRAEIAAKSIPNQQNWSKVMDRFFQVLAESHPEGEGVRHRWLLTR